MVGGTVVEVCDIAGDNVYIDVVDGNSGYLNHCAIHVQRNGNSEQIEIGDSIWWQGRVAMWTPQVNIGKENGVCGVDFDIMIPRTSYSGVSHP